MAEARSDSLSRTCSMWSSTDVPSANVAMVVRIGSTSGVGPQSTVTGRSGEPSCCTRTAFRVGSAVRLTPIWRAMSSTAASGWLVSAALMWVSPCSRMSEGCRAAAAMPNAAEPMSGGSVMVAGVACWFGAISKRRQPSATSTSSPNVRIISTVSSR